MIAEAPDKYERCLFALSWQNPTLAASPVPTGVTNYWGTSLGWPAWIFEGTLLSLGNPVPQSLTLVEDLQLVANLLRHVEERTLLRMLCDWPHFSGAAMVLAAPNLEAALRHYSQEISDKNRSIQLRAARHGRALAIRIHLEPLLGPFRSLIEQTVGLMLFLAARSLAGATSDAESALSRIEVRLARSGNHLGGILPCKTKAVTGIGQVIFPPELLASSNPGYSPDLWEQVRSGLPIDRPQDVPSGGFSRELLEAIVDNALTEGRKVPQLVEIARMLNSSERTISRLLASRNLSFREIIAATRYKRAREFLLRTDLTVSDIAARLGYGESSTFIRAFKRHFSVSPAAWRRQARGMNEKST